MPMAGHILDNLLTTLSVRLHAFALCEIDPGYRLSFDPMEGVTIHYVLEGQGTLQSGNSRPIAYDTNCIMVVPARTHQSLGDAASVFREVPADETCEIINDGLIKFLAGAGAPKTRIVCGTILATYAGTLGLFESLSEPIVVDTSDVEQLRYAFQAMLGELSSHAVGMRAMTEALMKQCLILVLRQQLLQRNVVSPFFASLQDSRLARAITAIVEEPAQPHTVSSLSALSGMSRSVFTERFKTTFGQTPIEFLTAVRLRLAAHLLATTDVPIKLISKSIGYSSRSHFSRSFRLAYGQDPASFRTFGTSPEDEPWSDAGVPPSPPA